MFPITGGDLALYHTKDYKTVLHITANLKTAQLEREIEGAKVTVEFSQLANIPDGAALLLERECGAG